MLCDNVMNAKCKSLSAVMEVCCQEAGLNFPVLYVQQFKGFVQQVQVTKNRTA